jgi:nitrogen regulatory protein P-II 1
MTKIETVIRPSQLEDVKRALTHLWITGLTVVEVSGWERTQRHREVRRGAGVVVEVVPQLRVEVVVPAPLAPRILFELERAARTGAPVGGRIVVTPVEEAVRVRTGERGESAL